MITMAMGYPGEGMSWLSLRRIFGTYLRQRPFLLTPAQAQRVLNAVLK
jgi:hypothetical protein